MKLICSRDILTESINIVSKAVSGRATLPILDCILLIASEGEGFKMVANDLEIGIETKFVEAEIIEPGEIALDARVFSDIVKRLPGHEVYIESMNNFVTLIKSGVAEFKILGSPGEEFPLLPEVEAEGGFEIFSGVLKNMIRQTIFSVSTDESKPVMTGEQFNVEEGTLRVASVDGHRISVRYEPVDNKELSASVIVPGKTLSEIIKILDSGEKSITSVYFTSKHILFETDEARIVSRLIEGKFMEFDNIFNSEGTTYMTIGAKDMHDCIERAVLISRETKKNPVKFTMDKEKGQIVVESNTETGTFREELSAEIDGLDLSISFNPRFLADILKAIDEEQVRFMFTTPLSPCIINGVDSEAHKYLVLPLRVMN